TGEKQLKRAKNEEVLQAIQTQGFYLQMPPPPENLLEAFLEQKRSL
ncbi:YcgL domain-containing protein, partial [uncultured Actinobacillus sp.]